MLDKIVNEIFLSVNGEHNPFGIGTIQQFLRFSGCNMTCPYCDTKHTQSLDSATMTLVSAIDYLRKQTRSTILNITGGEPLLYPHAIYTLVDSLQGFYKRFVVKTNGTISLLELSNKLASVKSRSGLFDIRYAFDFKLDNLPHPHNYRAFYVESNTLNFPICSVEDFYKAVYHLEVLHNMKEGLCEVSFSPISPITPAKLLELMNQHVKPEYGVVMNLQLHKSANLR